MVRGGIPSSRRPGQPLRQSPAKTRSQKREGETDCLTCPHNLSQGTIQMNYRRLFAALFCTSLLASPALAAPPAPHKFGDPVAVGDGLTLDPIIDARLR